MCGDKIGRNISFDFCHKNAEEFYMANTTKTAVEIEWLLDTPVRDDIYQYLIG